MNKASISNKKWCKNNPEKRKVHALMWHLKKSGKLKSLPCSICGNPKSHAHHADYLKPLEITWLCSKHHRILHAQDYPYKKSRLVEKAKKLRQGGMFYQNIAKTLGITIGTAYKWLNKVNYD